MDKHLEAFWRGVKGFGETVRQEAQRSVRSFEDVVRLCYFSKLQNSVYSAMILLGHSQVQDAKVLSRVIFENLMYLKGSTKETDFIALYVNEWVARKKRKGEDLKEFFSRDGTVSEHAAKRLEDIELGLKQADEIFKIHEEKIAKLTKFRMEAEHFAKKYNLKDQNRLFNQGHNDEVHSLPFAVGKHYNDQVGFVGYPDLEDSELVHLQIFWMFVDAIEEIVDVFKLEALRPRLKELDAIRQENELKYRDGLFRG